jgi:hypothetical protein
MPYATRYSTTTQEGQPLTVDEHLVWTVGGREELVAAHGTLARARELWSTQWRLVNTNPSNPPAAFWIFHGPRTLHGLAKTALAKVKTHADHIELEEQLEKRRRTWLAARGNDWREITSEATAGDETKATAHADDWTKA